MVLQQGLYKPRGWMSESVCWKRPGHGVRRSEFDWRSDSWWEDSGKQAGEVGGRHIVKGLDALLVFYLVLKQWRS